MKRSFWGSLSVCGLGAAIFVMQACTSSSAASQCSTDGDCLALGFTSYACGVDGVCKPSQTAVAGGDAGGFTDECTTNQECAVKNGQRPAICRKDPNVPTKCVPLQTDDCPVVYGPWEDPKAIYFASFAPISPKLDAAYVAFYQSEGRQMDVAVNDFNGAGGLPGTSGRRPLVHLTCNSGAAGYSHAANVVKVPAAIIPTETELAWLPIAKSHNIATFCSLCVGNIRAEAVAGGVDGSLSFGLLQAFDYVAPMYPYKMTQFEAQVRAARALQPSQPIKVAILGGDDAGSLYMVNAIQKILTFNNKTLTQNTADNNYKLITMATPLAGGTLPDPAVVASQIAAFAPDIVLPLTPGADWAYMLTTIETAWTAAYRPLWVAPLTAFPDRLDQLIGTDENLRKRIIGIKMLPTTNELSLNTTPQITSYVSRYNQVHPGETPLSILYDYDAVYLMAYAIAASGQRPFDALSGSDIATALPKVTTGATHFETVPSSITSALVSLATGPIKLDGLYTSLSFDYSDGSIPTDTGTWCVSKAADGTFSLKFTSEVFHWDTKTVTGTFDCP